MTLGILVTFENLTLLAQKHSSEVFAHEPESYPSFRHKALQTSFRTSVTVRHATRSHMPYLHSLVVWF